MTRRRRIGRVRIDFAVIETLAERVLPDLKEGSIRDDWVLSRKSSLHRRKDGSYTLSLIWKSGTCMTLHSTVRGLRLDAQR